MDFESAPDLVMPKYRIIIVEQQKDNVAVNEFGH